MENNQNMDQLQLVLVQSYSPLNKQMSQTNLNQSMTKSITKASFQFEEQKKRLQKKLMGKYCSQGKPAKNVCFSYCQEYAVICDDQDCMCAKVHSKCQLLILKNFNSKMISNLKDPSSIIESIQSQFQKMIDQISQTRDEIIKVFQDNYGLNAQELQYINCQWCEGNINMQKNFNGKYSNWFNPSSAYQKNSKFNSTEYSGNREDSLRLLQYEVYQIVEQKPQQVKV